MFLNELYEGIDRTNAVKGIVKLIHDRGIEFRSFDDLQKFVYNLNFLKPHHNDTQYMMDVARFVLRRLHDEKITESSGTIMMGKLARSGKIVRIIRKQHSVKFSNEKDWLLIDADPAQGNRGQGLKWIPANTDFEWVRPYLEKIDEISDEKLQDYLSRAGSKVDRRMTHMAQARDRLNKGYEIYHAENPNKVVDRFEANTPKEAQRYYNNFIANYESDRDYDLRLRRATGIIEEAQVPADIKFFLNNLVPDDVGVEEIGPYRIHFEGFTDECKSSSDYCENPEAVYQQVFADHIAREGGRKPLVQDMTGDEEYPILYSIFKKSKTVKESVDAYHGTFQPTLSKFNSLSHFGTLKAAQDRLNAKARREKIKTPGRIYQVTLDIKNPFVAKDFAGVHSATHFAFDLKNQGLISQEEMLAITNLAGEPGQVPALVKKLRELGFDSIAYKNKYEDKGSTSYVILDPSQVVSVKPVTTDKTVSEAFNQPYRLTWEQGEYGSYDAYTQLPDGSGLSINFNLESAGPYGTDEEWHVEFWRNQSLAVTGEGDAQRIFATVLAAIADFIEQENPDRIVFSASKEVEPGQNAQSRSKLYDRLVQRYAAGWGYRVVRYEQGDKVLYELEKANLQEGVKEWLAGIATVGAMLFGAPSAEAITQQQYNQTAQILASAPAQILKKVAIASGITGSELAQFMAQCAHETANFTSMKEHGGSLDFKKYDIRHNPRKAKALGNVKPGDGAKYHGRGYIQLTGRDNYKRAGQALGLPLEQHPELVEKPDVAAKVAVWFWKSRVQPKVQSFHDTQQVTKPINPGMRGLSDRQAKFDAIKQGAMATQKDLAPRGRRI